MKNSLNLSWLFLLASMPMYAQISGTKKSTVPLIQQREIYLNGGTRSAFDGHSRVTLKIDLPPNTKSWYYSFSTSAGQSGVENLNLAIQLSALILEPSLSRPLVDNLRVPPGSSAIDVYLLDQPNSDLFFGKADLHGGNFNYFREGSGFNMKHGAVEIDEIISGTFYLGLKNPGLLDGINVVIEVVALVEEVDDSQATAITYGNLGWKAFEDGNYDRCLELSQRALNLDNNLSYIHFNIGAVYLVKGMNDLALEEYTKAITMTKKMTPNRQIFEGAIQDLKKYMLQFSSQTDAHEILDILDMELQTSK